MSLAFGIAILAFAVLLGGVAALRRAPGQGAMPAIRTFAVVAAVSIALLHLLPEAISDLGPKVLIATAIGIFGPALLERVIPSHEHHSHQAPTTALAMGYAAVIVHQASEGAALAGLAQTGALSIAIVLAIAAHTVPLAMVVAIRVLEVKSGPRAKGATVLALVGVAGATAVGAGAGSLLGGDRLGSVQPWLLASVAGLLLHALSHDALAAPGTTTKARWLDTFAGWAGLMLAILGVESGTWLDRVPLVLRGVGIAVLGGAIAARSFWPRRAAEEHHGHHH